MRKALPVVLALATAGCTSTLNATTPEPSTPTTYGTPTTVSIAGTCHYQALNLPDPLCTPGVTNPEVTQANIQSTICVRGWTSTIRPPVSYTDELKRQQMTIYALPGSTADYEEDHRVPLEVGGNPTSPQNLWPEPWSSSHGAHAKDLIENHIHALVCSGAMTLSAGQHYFEGNWWQQ